MTYLDNSATTAVCQSAVDRMVQVMTKTFGNPSSLHSLGVAAETELTRAREEVSQLLGVKAERLIFTGGGTEANNLSILGCAQAKRRSSKKAVVSAVEHPSVAVCFDALEAEGWQVTRLLPDADGMITPAQVAAACDADTTLVSVMRVNNETGALFDIPEMVKQVKRIAPQAVFHTDAVQAAGKLPIAAERWNVDLLTASSHKIHGPKGCGVLYVRKGVRLCARALGGEQEQGLRAGTEGVPAIAGFGAAAASVPDFAVQQEVYERLKTELMAGISALPDIVVHTPRIGVPYIVNLSVVGFRSETLLNFLAEREIYVSSGSACARGKTSPVLTALGLPEREIDSALRISFCRDTTTEDICNLCVALKEAQATLKRRTW